MVQSNPLCRLETADTAEERRIGALSNRYIYDDHDGRVLLLFTVHNSASTSPISPSKEMNTMTIGGGFGWLTLTKS